MSQRKKKVYIDAGPDVKLRAVAPLSLSSQPRKAVHTVYLV